MLLSVCEVGVLRNFKLIDEVSLSNTQLEYAITKKKSMEEVDRIPNIGKCQN